MALGLDVQFGGLYVVRVEIIPGDAALRIEVQRAPDLAGAPDTANAVTIREVGPFPKAGGVFTDPRPSDGATWWYRCRHLPGLGVDYGPYTSWLSGVAKSMPIIEWPIIREPAVYPVRRDIALTDGDFTPRATDAAGTTLKSTIVDSAARAVNVMFGKTTDDLSDVADDGAGVWRKLASVNASGLAQTSSYGDGTVTKAKTEARSRCRVTHSVNQSITTGTLTKLNWDTEAYDVGGLHDPVTNNSRITIPTGGNVGVWLISANVQFAANSTGGRYVDILKNNTTVLAAVQVPAAPAGGTVGSTLVVVLFVDDAPTAGDYYEIRALQDSGGALDVVSTTSWFAAQHLW